MKSIRAISVIITLMLVFFACGNKSIKTEPVLNDEMTEGVSLHPDTTLHSVKAEEMKGNEKSTTLVSSSSSSSSRSNSSGGYDNMRGFDPASEDDMDDNGMSRYMENNDEEGWD